jgi:cell division protein FtsI (penicillin-binding protein 3)
LDFIDDYSRIYPNRQLAAQVLGFAGVDGNGLEGIEFYYDEYLRGNTYRQTVVRDALGRIFQREESRSPDTEGKIWS